MRKTAFITGASSGIGKATAELLSEQGIRVILAARRYERISDIAGILNHEKEGNAFALQLDVRDSAAIDKALSTLPPEWQQIDILINNAGLAAGMDNFDEADLDDWDRMIDTNVKGLLYVTRALTPSLKQSPGAHIVNIGSIAGKEVYPKGNVYCGTKHFVDAITRSMRAELLPFGIKVSQVAPGAVETEFSEVRFHGDKNRAANVYKGYDPLRAADVADAIGYILSLPPHVCVNDIVLMPTAQANAVTFDRKA